MKRPNTSAQMKDVTPGSIEGGRRCIEGNVRQCQTEVRHCVSDHKFAEPVALSSTASADLPLPGTALRSDFVLLALRARRKSHTNVLAEEVKGSKQAVCAICALFFFLRCASDSCSLKRVQNDEPAPGVRVQKNSRSRFRFRPPLPLTFPFRVLPSDSVSTYLRSVLRARGNLTGCTTASRGRKETWPQFANISFFNMSTANLPTCGQPCGKENEVAAYCQKRHRGRVRTAPGTITHGEYSCA